MDVDSNDEGKNWDEEENTKDDGEDKCEDKVENFTALESSRNRILKMNLINQS